MGKKHFCIPLYTELLAGEKELRKYQKKPIPVVNGQEKTSVTTLMASMAVDVARSLNRVCL